MCPSDGTVHLVFRDALSRLIAMRRNPGSSSFTPPVPLPGEWSMDPGLVGLSDAAWLFAVNHASQVSASQFDPQARAWRPFQNLGGQVTSSLTAAFLSTGLWVYCRGADSAIWGKGRIGEFAPDWSPREEERISAAPCLLMDPTSSPAPGWGELFARTLDGQIVRRMVS
jgi:hypothetical protein